MFRLHFSDTFINALDRLEFVHGFYVHHDFGIRDIEQIRTPRVPDAQGIIGNRKDRRFGFVHQVLIRLELHLVRYNPIDQFLVLDFSDFPFVEVA